jgi:excisionase family DNA binding protein
MSRLRRIWTPPQLADEWGCRADAVRHLCETGKLRAFKVGKSHWRITDEAVREYERGETPPPAEPPRRRRRSTRREIPTGPF